MLRGSQCVMEKNKIIFLDFDGVLTTENHTDGFLARNGLPIFDKYGFIFDPVCVYNLKTVIRETNADIVISSTWKLNMSLDNIRSMWKDRNLPGNVIDSTPFIDTIRGDEIDDWLNNHDVDCKYAIIDDMGKGEFNEHQYSHLFQTEAYYGLDKLTAMNVIEFLNEE